VQGMQDILTGYQCGSVYKPIYLESRLRRRRSLPACGPGPAYGLVGTNVIDTASRPARTRRQHPGRLETRRGLHRNMEKTVVADGLIRLPPSAMASAQLQAVRIH